MTSTASGAPTTAEERRELSRGLLGALVAVCAWSTGTVLTKYIDMGGLAVGAYRFGMFALAIIVWMRWRGTPFTLQTLRNSWMGGIALGADIALFFSAVKLTSIVNATIIGSLQPIVVGVVAARFFGERIRPRDALWSLSALAGVAVIVSTSSDGGVSDIRGDLLAAAAMLSWSAYFIASKQSKARMSSTEFTAGTAVWTTAICAPLGVVFGQDMSWPSTGDLLLLAAMAAGSGVVGHALMNWSLVRIPLWVGSTFTLFIPVASALMAWAFLGERFTWIQATAMGLVIASLAMIVRGQSRPA